MRHTELSPRAIAETALQLAAEICIYTNAQPDDRGAGAVTALTALTDEADPGADRRASSTATSSARRDAKRAVAVAMRNRWRRQQVEGELRDEIAPKNIIMIGPTGVGKTEIARRLARLARAPFLKVEASQVHRGRLRRPRRRLDRARSRRGLGQARPRRGGRQGPAAREGRRRGAPARPAAAAAAGSGVHGTAGGGAR